MIQRHAARGELERLPSLLPRLTYVCVAPFMGAPEAIEFLRGQVCARSAGPRS